MGQRRVELLELVSQHGKIEVNELSRLLHASQVTVRKDLEYLTEKGILRRKRGYAMLKHPDDINYQMAFQYEEKENKKNHGHRDHMRVGVVWGGLCGSGHICL